MLLEKIYKHAWKIIGFSINVLLIIIGALYLKIRLQSDPVQNAVSIERKISANPQKSNSDSIGISVDSAGKNYQQSANVSLVKQAVAKAASVTATVTGSSKVR